MTNVIDKLAWLHIQDGKILSTRSRGSDTYYIPGGKREGSETDHEALIREIHEELTIDLLPETISYVDTFEAQAHGKADGVIVKMTCYTAGYSGVITPAAEIEEVVWLDYSGRDHSSPVDQIIFDWLFEKKLLV